MHKHGWTVGGVFSGLGRNPRRLISDWVHCQPRLPHVPTCKRLTCPAPLLHPSPVPLSVCLSTLDAGERGVLVTQHESRLPYIGSARTEVVRFFGCGGLTTFLAPGRGTYGSVWSAAFQRCKKRAKILKWRQMRAFSGSVLEWCGRAVPARLLPQEPPSGRTVPASRPNGSCPAGRFLPSGSCPAEAVPARLLPGSCPVPARFLPGSCDRRNGSCQTAFRNREL